MIKKHFLTIVIFCLLMIAFWLMVKNTVNKDKLASPNLFHSFNNSTPITVPIPTPNAPKTFTFDASTNLKDELNKINPQVLDSDFE